MVATLNWLLVLASESHGIPGDDWRAQAAVPIGVLLFLGSVFMLLRANLGTKRGYLVTATSLFGFMIVYALFWTFGAPGTPPATGPQNLPGQELDAYEDTWRPFAADSLLAGEADYDVAKSYPEGFSDTPEGAGVIAKMEAAADTGSDDIRTFFSTAQSPEAPTGLKTPLLTSSWEEIDRKYAKADNGRTIIGVTYQQTWQIGKLPQGVQPEEGAEPALTPDGDTVVTEDDPETEENDVNVAPAGTEIGALVEDGPTYTAFAYFDPGSPKFPSLVTLAIMLVLFLIHLALLAADERRERREREAPTTEAALESEPVTAGAADRS